MSPNNDTECIWVVQIILHQRLDWKEENGMSVGWSSFLKIVVSYRIWTISCEKERGNSLNGCLKVERMWWDWKLWVSEYFFPRRLWKRVIIITAKACGGATGAWRGRYDVNARHPSLFKDWWWEVELTMPVGINRPRFWLFYIHHSDSSLPF